jgi:LysR family transcriptional regulator, transcriptional activator of the cysJI operon
MSDFRLIVFQRVAQNLSFTKAANELFVSQPAITKHIKELESEYGSKLFERSGNKIRLTEAGSILLNYTNKILHLHNELKFELSQLTNQFEGTLRLGASTTIAQYVLPSALASFHNSHPLIKLSLISGNTEFIEKRLLKNEIDFAIVEGKPSNQDIRYTPFLDDELLVFTSSKNSSTPESITNKDFINLPFVLRERGSGTLEIIEENLHNHNISPRQLNVLMFLGSTEAIKTFIKTGNGAGIVSRFAIENELNEKQFRQIATPEISFLRQFFFIFPQGPDPSGSTKLFHNFLLKLYNL